VQVGGDRVPGKGSRPGQPMGRAAHTEVTEPERVNNSLWVIQ
jgi:hypothetical protein